MMIRQRWIELLNTVTTGTRKTGALLAPKGILIFGTFTALFVLSAVVVDRILNLPGLPPEGARSLLRLFTPLYVLANLWEHSQVEEMISSSAWTKSTSNIEGGLRCFYPDGKPAQKLRLATVDICSQWRQCDEIPRPKHTNCNMCIQGM